MGAEAWTTIPSKDGGVDAVATSKHLFFGGVCLIQAKRWTGLVGLESVHALTGVMADHNATTGVLVTTSWFGRAFRPDGPAPSNPEVPLPARSYRGNSGR
jgi:restriction system protein